MDELEQAWPDPDRRDGALERLLIRVHSHQVELAPADLLALRFASHGLTEAETAAAIGYSKATVHDRLKRCRRLLAAKSTTQAVAEALRQGLIS
jgi:DNA-binding CsgD family transcriptional regulator